MVHTYKRILLSLKKEGKPDTCYNIDEPLRLQREKKNQSQKDKYCMILLTQGRSRTVQLIETAEWWLPGKKRMGNYCLVGTKCQFCMMGKSWRWTLVMVSQQHKHTEIGRAHV